MRQVRMSQRTFGRRTKREIRELVPTACGYKSAAGGGKIITDSDGQTVATWHAPQISFARYSDGLYMGALLVIR